MHTFASYFPVMVDMAVKSTIFLGLAWIAGLLLKNRSAALRHTVRACALCAVLLLPALSYLLPAWHWQSLPQFPLVEKQSAAATETPAALPAVPQSDTGSRELALPRARASSTTQPANYRPASSALSKSRIAMNWTQLLIVSWLLGTMLVALRLLVSRSRFALLISKAVPVHDAAWTSQIREIAHLLGIRRAVALLESQDTEVPLATGAWRPKIVLSPDHAEWSPLRRDAILRHELAHIRRLDTLAQTLGHAALAMYWFHPLVWLTVRAMRAEREQACDDYVLAAGTKPSQYAHELLEIASSLRRPQFITALAMARRSQLEGRVMALLNPAQRRGSISQKTSLAVAALTLCAVLPLAAIQTAVPQKQSSKPRTETAPRQNQNTPSAPADVEEPSMTEQPREATQPPSPAPQVAPLPPAAAAPPVAGVVDGVVGGVAGGVVGGVPGGVRGGVPGKVRSVPPIPPIPASPHVAPAVPQIVPPPVPPQAVPAAPQMPTAPPAAAPRSIPALPKMKTPRALPVPQPAPIPPAPVPEVAPSAPEMPSTPPAETASPAPQAISAPQAASTADTLSALKARLVAIHAQADAKPLESEALRAKIAALAATASSANATRVAELRAQTEVIAAKSSSASDQVAALRAQLAALAAGTPQAASTSPKVAALRARIAALRHVASTPVHAAGASEPCAPDASHPQKNGDHP